MSTNSVNIAVAGLGRMGKRHVYTLINRVPRADVVAVCSSEAHELAWAREEYKDSGIEVYSSYDRMLEHPGLNAVWVSTSTDVHASMTLAGIEKGLHVLCEKPLSTDMEEVRTRTNCRPKVFSSYNEHLNMIPFPMSFQAHATNTYKSHRPRPSSMSPLSIPS